eukprot:comp22305_c0_seq1/m.53402 comp22305_c0_seq1/g.53402  ORF comp22305_c0_seq1/g.53402 comp22305_c0_seq1/m.53402 type:complete len:323 (+) comp22305_c0_seq1:561-1529(+)
MRRRGRQSRRQHLALEWRHGARHHGRRRRRQRAHRRRCWRNQLVEPILRAIGVEMVLAHVARGNGARRPRRAAAALRHPLEAAPENRLVVERVLRAWNARIATSARRPQCAVVARLADPTNQLSNTRKTNRLVQKHVHAALETFLLDRVERVGGERKHKRRRHKRMLALPLADLHRGRKPVKHGHVAVHENTVVAVRLVQLHGLEPIGCNIAAVAKLLHNAAECRLGHRVVVRNQHIQLLGRLRLRQALLPGRGRVRHRALRAERRRNNIHNILAADRLHQIERCGQLGDIRLRIERKRKHHIRRPAFLGAQHKVNGDMAVL